MTMPQLEQRYQMLAASPDGAQRRLAAKQLARLSHRPTLPSATLPPAEHDGLLVTLVERVAGPLKLRPNGTQEGPCPWHGSRSGQCLIVFADGRRWYCRSCRRGGDVVAWLALTEGVSFGEARRRLGLPAPRRQPRPRLRAVTYD